MTPPDETYLGDGLYASFDGYHVTLRATRSDGDHWVALEPGVFDELLQFGLRVGIWRPSK
jgi:hypothetical protein